MMPLPVDLVASSATLGCEKPARAFFERLAELAGVPSGEAAYVGDRLDNDVVPARRAGMVAVFVRRGPWGHLHAFRPESELAHLTVEHLGALPEALRAYSL
jgi:FMN phosphatase YigB (HAD superfamily)